ncbi:MAG: RNA 3'-terminal phosphate cyclase [Candidatus Nanoarchaeia archaeon]|nr:RNA 3'-terminal phosphate cyclase [Candidatus Nanoarchaeia archaeon]
MIELSLKDFSQTALNISLSLASLLKKDLKLTHLEKLDETTILAINVLREGTGAYIEGAIENSHKLIFQPTKHFSLKKISATLPKGEPIYEFLQPLLLPTLFSGKKITFDLEGATSSAINPSYDYIKEVQLRYFTNFISKQDFHISSAGFLGQNNGKVKLILQSKSEFSSTPLKKLNLLYYKDIIGIKLILNTNKELMKENFVDNIRDLFKFSFPKIPISVLPRYFEDIEGISLDAFILFGENNSFDNDLAFVKGQSLIAPQEFTLSSSNFQQIILDFILSLKEKISKEGIDIFLALDLIPLLGLFGGEIIVEEVNKDILDVIFVVETIVDVKFKVLGNKIQCVEPYEQDIISIDDL